MTGRNDWDSRLAKEIPQHHNRSYFYPEADAAFIFSQLLKNNGPGTWLSYGKVRAAVSQVGQVTVNPYSLVNAFDNGAGFPLRCNCGL